MAITLNRLDLTSRQTRQQLTNNQPRKINLNYSFAESGQNIIQRIFSLAGRLTGFLVSVIRSISVSATQLFGWAVAGFTQLANFNWNTTDAQIEEAIRQRNISLAGVWGSTTGVFFGQLAPIAIGYGIAHLIPVVGGSALGRAVVADALPEALEEIWASLRSSIVTTLQTMATNQLARTYVNVRQWLKGKPRDFLANVFGENATIVKWLDLWGSNSAPRFTFAEGIEESVENIGNPYLRAFTENALDEFFDSFVESGYIVAQSLDQNIAELKAAQKQLEGEQRTVLIRPDNENLNEAFPLTGSESQLKQTMQTTINQYRMTYNRDIGQIVGMPEQDWVRTTPQRRKLTIVFQSVDRPPYYRRGNRDLKGATYTIPEPKTNLTWRQIKLAAKAFNWGKFRAQANLTNGRQMAVYGATGAEAEEKLKDLLELSTCEVSSLSITEEKDRNPRLRKTATRLYPAYGTMLMRRPTVDPDEGRATIDGQQLAEETVRFDLWRDEEPDEFEAVRFGVETSAN